MNIRRGFWTSYPGLAVRLLFWAPIGFALGVAFALICPFYGVWLASREELEDFRHDRDFEDRGIPFRRVRRSLAERARVLIGDSDADVREAEGNL